MYLSSKEVLRKFLFVFIFNLLKLSFSTEMAEYSSSMRYVIDLKADIYYDSGATPHTSYVLADRMVTNKIPCVYNSTFLIEGKT